MKRPRLLAQPRIGIQSGSERAFDFMAKYGISGGSAEGGAVAPTRGIDNTPLP